MKEPSSNRTRKGDAMSLIAIAVVLAVLATLFSLLSGVSSMATGHAVSQRTSEQWMVLRIACQGAAVLLLLFAMLE
jgi:hypothetical protein